MASHLKQSSDLWDLEHHLTQRRKEIDRKYDYRYSQLKRFRPRILRHTRLYFWLHVVPGLSNASR
jgi:hypothetical protein